MSKQKAIMVSGYFNPIHKGHIEYINTAKSLVDALFVIVNNDQQRALKGSKEFQEETERLFIVYNLKAVDHALLSTDGPNGLRYDCQNCQNIRSILCSGFCQWG